MHQVYKGLSTLEADTNAHPLVLKCLGVALDFCLVTTIVVSIFGVMFAIFGN